MDLVELKVEIPVDGVEATDTVLLELGVEGWSLVEDVIVKRAWLVGIFPGHTEALERWAELRLLLPVSILGQEQLRRLSDSDWRDSYKAHFKAWCFGRLHWVPVWERESFRLPPGEEVLWLDPGLAFGTGNHETTRLCVERLMALDAEIVASGRSREGLAVIDAGCGSGILALSAAKLGFLDIVGFDNDPEAVRVSEENAQLNELTGRVEFLVGDLTTGLQGRLAGVVLANILADVLIRFAPELVGAVAPGGTLILSGILAAENAQVMDTYASLAAGWKIDSRVMGEWSDVCLTRPT